MLLKDDVGGTLLELRHSGLPHENSRRSHAEGWERYLDRLAEVAPAAPNETQPMRAGG